ncbi:ribosomal protein 60S [Metschnikowia bicuspidata var. bicuspidata NRRL YB-4993]|uniref:Ribosomal protein 60S n=1 Tax=Metschnikowia bicuspidata var. bicuspidata NRRL YB-4993 TaxID=869754 RepID=A0A1A0H9M1_9ASCO|nr:ribosomal protein 60S [Metschnikowia bicuspidata var. bicuspidata NRRL YB-4993]OBA20711.1 ribosomal protein 60S [Metschnikowia bicuspidata var. bicuspidata NRRL YB-4993]
MSTESALSYAALILADADVEITSDKLSTLVTEAKVEFEPIWADLFAKALEGKNLKDFFFNFSAAPAASAGGAAAVSGGAEEAAAEEKVEEAKEESDDDMGFGLFD